MKRKLITGLLLLALIAVPLFAVACGDEELPPDQQGEEEEEGQQEEEEANWWDAWGEPQYSGEITMRTDQLDYIALDPIGDPSFQKWQNWAEFLFSPNMVVDRDVWSFQMAWLSPEYATGLVESWEQTDPLTVTLNIRQGVLWQDKPPVNGREFTAADVEYNFDRVLGTGNGFTEQNPFFGPTFANIERVTATDEYTAVITLKQPDIFIVGQIINSGFKMVPREWVELPQEDRDNWENAVGTGAWILTDYVSGSSISYSSNPDYWGEDPRYPGNQLPYADTFTQLAIADMATAIAAMRTGQIDLIADMYGAPTWQQAQSLADTNPDIQQAWWPADGSQLSLRCDTAPFTDIRVRKALQLAVDIETIATGHYGGTVEGIPCGLVNPDLTGWVTPYDEWSQELQDEYVYNPTLAMELLAEAAADGVFEPNDLGGFDTSIVAPADFDIVLLEAIRSYFLDIGVDMAIEKTDMPTFFGIVGSGNFDQMVYAPNSGMTQDPLYSIRYRTTGFPRNFTYNNDPQYDALVEQALSATTMAEAQELCREADLYTLAEHWSVNICPVVVPVFYQSWIKGYSGEFIGGTTLIPYQYVNYMWIDQSLK